MSSANGVGVRPVVRSIQESTLRNSGLDALRAALTLLVIFHHCAITRVRTACRTGHDRFGADEPRSFVRRHVALLMAQPQIRKRSHVVRGGLVDIYRVHGTVLSDCGSSASFARTGRNFMKC